MKQQRIESRELVVEQSPRAHGLLPLIANGVNSSICWLPGVADGVQCRARRKSADLISLSDWKSSGSRASIIKPIFKPPAGAGGCLEHYPNSSDSTDVTPSMAEFSSNHIQINMERERCGLPPLQRKLVLDQVARQQAELMAKKNKVFHSEVSNIFLFVTSSDRSCRCKRMGENVTKGRSLREIHAGMMRRSTSGVNNILNPKFKSMGVGTCMGKNGRLFLCQVFEG
mmetsp:Transcript_37379/g.57366  ORF Transcript_37379/g.57366 Transcript_37379/m.57366 type:complete len:227 (+) Transcript_37379:71-751(+)